MQQPPAIASCVLLVLPATAAASVRLTQAKQHWAGVLSPSVPHLHLQPAHCSCAPSPRHLHPAHRLRAHVLLDGPVPGPVLPGDCHRLSSRAGLHEPCVQCQSLWPWPSSSVVATRTRRMRVSHVGARGCSVASVARQIVHGMAAPNAVLASISGPINLLSTHYALAALSFQQQECHRCRQFSCDTPGRPLTAGQACAHAGPFGVQHACSTALVMPTAACCDAHATCSHIICSSHPQLARHPMHLMESPQHAPSYHTTTTYTTRVPSGPYSATVVHLPTTSFNSVPGPTQWS